MTSDNELRIEMAKALGWRATGSLTGVTKGIPPTLDARNMDNLREVPDWPQCLNAMHEAVMSQSTEFRVNFEDALTKEALRFGKLVCELTASDHTRVFLRTKGVKCG